MAVVLLLALTLLLAFANGANDVSKGIATLVGSGVSNYRRAVAWGSLCTVAGALAAAFASQGLLATFSGKGILNDGRFMSFAGIWAAAKGTSPTSRLRTWIGMTGC